MRADLLEQAEAEARRLAAVSEQAATVFRRLGGGTATVLAERLAELSELVRRSDGNADGKVATFLPTLVEQLRTMTAAVEQLVAVSSPLLDLGLKLESAMPRLR